MCVIVRPFQPLVLIFLCFSPPDKKNIKSIKISVYFNDPPLPLTLKKYYIFFFVIVLCLVKWILLDSFPAIFLLYYIMCYILASEQLHKKSMENWISMTLKNIISFWALILKNFPPSLHTTVVDLITVCFNPG